MNKFEKIFSYVFLCAFSAKSLMYGLDAASAYVIISTIAFIGFREYRISDQLKTSLEAKQEASTKELQNEVKFLKEELSIHKDEYAQFKSNMNAKATMNAFQAQRKTFGN